jgi:hypothetical protein
MAAYTLHVDGEAHPGDPRALDRAVVLKDGFSWGAFFFTVLWFFAHRLWLAGLFVLAAVLALVVGAYLAGAGFGAIWLAVALFSVLVGLEASSLRRWTLARRGRPAVDVLSAGSAAEAETKAFERWLAGDSTKLESAAVSPTRPRPAQWQPPAPVLGLFPEAERRR